MQTRSWVEGDLFESGETRSKTNMMAMLSSYLRFWYVFLLFVIVSVAAAYLRIRYTSPEYFVGSTILIKDRSESSGVAANPALADMGVLQPAKAIEDQIIILRSKSLMTKALHELSLNASFFIEGRVHDMEVYEKDLPVRLIISELRPEGYGKRIVIYPGDNNWFQVGETTSDGRVIKTTHKFGEQINKPYGVFTVINAADTMASPMNGELIVIFHDVEKLANQYSNALGVTRVDKGASILNVGLTGPVYKKSIDILNKLIEVYEEEAMDDKNRLASNTLSFIDERLRYLSTELTNVEKDVELYKVRNDLTDVSSEAELYLKSADEYSKQLAEYEIQIELLQSIEDYLEKQGEQFELVPSSLNIQDPTLVALITKFNELQLERQRMLRTTRPDNPLIQNLNEQLNNLRINIGENIQNIMKGLVITRERLINSSAKFAHKKKKVPAMERELLEINRQQGVKEGLYLYLLQKREESALSLAANVANFRVIDPPAVIHPIVPNKPLIYLAAIVIGLIIPFSILYVKNFFNDKVMSISDIKRLTDTPVLGEIVRNRTRQFLVVSKEATSPIVEMLRLIRANIHFSMLGRENKVILVTSSMSGEGKTFFSVNLAASLVLTGKRVVLLGMDLRKPTALKSLDLTDGLGITNYLMSDRVSLSDIVRPLSLLPNLSFVTSGPVLPSPTELMMSPRMSALLDGLRASFDHIIIDSAPVGLVADAFTLAPFIDSTIYLVRNNYTPKNTISIVDRIFKEKKLESPMIVFNDARLEKGYKYGYGYGYGYGYSHDKKRKRSKDPVKKAVPESEVVSVG